MKIFFYRRKLTFVTIFLLGFYLFGCESFSTGTSSHKKFHTTDVTIQLPNELLTTHRLSGSMKKEGRLVTKQKTAKTKNNIIFQGVWLGDIPHGKGVCYQESEKAVCYYFQGILVHYDTESESRRNTAMQRCLGMVSKQLQNKYPTLISGTALYKKQQQKSLIECYSLTNTLFQH